MTDTEKRAHSADYFTDARDFWWNADFLDLMARRWRLSDVTAMLDVGCGVGHWGRLLARYLPAHARVVGVDAEAEWVAEASRRAPQDAGTPRFSYVRGSVEALPFDDATFDMVTCQTVLMHVPDARHALAEMKRVLKPGGLLAVAEPNNLAHAVVRSLAQMDDDLDRWMERIRFDATCLRGKRALGLGDDTVGDFLPAWIAQAGFSDVEVHLSDMADAYIPPYRSAREQAGIREAADYAARDFYIWPRPDARKYFIAGGGDVDQFDNLWAARLQESRIHTDGFKTNTTAHAGGAIFYLIAGRT